MRFTNNWFDCSANNFIKFLSPHKGEPGIKYLEIGSYEGRSALSIADHILTGLGSEIHCVDTFEGSIEHTEKQKDSLYDRFMNNLKGSGIKNVTVHKMTSREYWMNNNEMFDFIYIDGDHNSCTVIEDAMCAWQRIKPGGVIAFHDYEGGGEPICTPKPAIDFFLLSHYGKYDLLLKGYQVWVRRKIL